MMINDVRRELCQYKLKRTSSAHLKATGSLNLPSTGLAH